MKDKFTYWILSTLSKLFYHMSFSRRTQVANRLAATAFNRVPIRKSMAIKNMKRAFPQKNDRWIYNTLKKCYRIFSMNFIQFLALPISYDSRQIRVVGRHFFDEAISRGKGVLLVTGHFGLWEMLAAWLGENGYPCYGIIAKQKNAGGDKFFKNLRSLIGMNQIYRNSVRDSMYRVLQEKNVLILASDQDARHHGVFVDFFNQPSSTPKGVAIFHMRTKSPMVFCTARLKEPRTVVIEFEPVPVNGKATIESITQAYTTLLENKVRAYPDHYFWFHRKWKTKPTF